jgi:stage III sporulation protein AG
MLQGKKLTKWLSDKRIVKIAVVIGTVAVLLIGLSSFIDFSGSEKDNSDRYAAKTEAHLLEIISQISGVGEAKIFLTMDNGGENVYLKNTDTKTKSIEPKVRGVVVVCDGGDDPLVVARVMDAVTKSLNIGSDKVCITK